MVEQSHCEKVTSAFHISTPITKLKPRWWNSQLSLWVKMLNSNDFSYKGNGSWTRLQIILEDFVFKNLIHGSEDIVTNTVYFHKALTGLESHSVKLIH